ncbi:MAG: arsenic resistance protein [Acidovorax sp.]|uniref:arsenic resistance protein n=1 Tax=Acidovorax sp. TaxID=1872122 RepID=UPI00391AEAA4
MTRLALERHQVWVYLLAIALGLGVGSLWPAAGPALEALLWPTLAVLLFATFMQVPLLQLGKALRDRRFAAAVVIGNFVVLPLLAWVLVAWLGMLGASPAVRLGVLLVLLVPCTDWFITFSQLSGGDVPRAMAVTPLNLVLQLLLLPAYLWLMGDATTLVSFHLATLAPALLVVVVPLAGAAVAQRTFKTHPKADAVREALAWTPVPLLAVVVFLIAGAQVSTVWQGLHVLPQVVPVFVVFLVAAALVAKALARWLALPAAQGRTLAFSLGTRNSFVVLPFALALPAGWEATAVVVVVQSLVELLGMAVYLWWVPRRLFVGSAETD